MSSEKVLAASERLIEAVRWHDEIRQDQIRAVDDVNAALDALREALKDIDV